MKVEGPQTTPPTRACAVCQLELSASPKKGVSDKDLQPGVCTKPGLWTLNLNYGLDYGVDFGLGWTVNCVLDLLFKDDLRTCHQMQPCSI